VYRQALLGIWGNSADKVCVFLQVFRLSQWLLFK
jgi:hypothetical protein